MEIEIESHTYRIHKIDARSQFHIVRRLAPVLGQIVPAVQAGAGGMDALPPLANAIAGLSDDDADYVLFGLLKAMSRKQDSGLGWGPVSTGNAIMYDDISMSTMLKLAWEVMSYNMAGFFQGMPSDLNAESLKANAQ